MLSSVVAQVGHWVVSRLLFAFFSASFKEDEMKVHIGEARYCRRLVEAHKMESIVENGVVNVEFRCEGSESEEASVELQKDKTVNIH